MLAAGGPTTPVGKPADDIIEALKSCMGDWVAAQFDKEVGRAELERATWFTLGEGHVGLELLRLAKVGSKDVPPLDDMRLTCMPPLRVAASQPPTAQDGAGPSSAACAAPLQASPTATPACAFHVPVAGASARSTSAVRRTQRCMASRAATIQQIAGKRTRGQQASRDLAAATREYEKALEDEIFAAREELRGPVDALIDYAVAQAARVRAHRQLGCTSARFSSRPQTHCW